VLRVGHFPNVTHAQALVAHGMSRAGKGWFEERVGAGTRVEWFTFDAGPTAMESLLAGNVDLAYVGPNPAINAHLRTGGDEVRVVAGAATGGSALVVRKGSAKGPADLRGKRLATPQLGNTQDVALRAWLGANGIRVTQSGGDASVVPTGNADMLALFAQGRLDAAWTVEPWVSRLETEAGGEVLVEEPEALTTVLVASERVLRERPEAARRFVAAHRELTEWILAHEEEAKEILREEVRAETTRPLAKELLDRAWPRIRLRSDVALEAFVEFQRRAREVGFADAGGDLSRLVEPMR
jgi:NitT/TauT family transport system substrate-binding protein